MSVRLDSVLAAIDEAVSGKEFGTPCTMSDCNYLEAAVPQASDSGCRISHRCKCEQFFRVNLDDISARDRFTASCIHVIGIAPDCRTEVDIGRDQGACVSGCLDGQALGLRREG